MVKTKEHRAVINCVYILFRFPKGTHLCKLAVISSVSLLPSCNIIFELLR